MDGIHDMGGLQGFGPIETSEPESMGFHENWHARMFALSRALRFVLPFGGDHVRAAMERMEPSSYLAASYYHIWLVGNVACLTSLGAVSEAELDRYTVQLAGMLEHFEDIDALDLSDVEPMTQPYPLVNVLRSDVEQPTLDRDEVLAAAPAAEQGRFRVPPTIGIDL